MSISRNNLKKAEKYLKESIDLFNNENDIFEDQLLLSYTQIGNIYRKRKEFKKALNYLHRSKKISKKFVDKTIVNSIYTYLGITYLEMKKYLLAEKYLIYSYKNSRNKIVMIDKAKTEEGLAMIYLKLRDFKKMKYYFKRAITTYSQLSMKRDIYELEEKIEEYLN